jgi:tRNA uridine 5-carbamoylmethylation protein Kti12
VIVIVCGPPGSGKSTLATRLRRRLLDRGYRFELRHSDDYERRTYDRMYADVAAAYDDGSDTHWILDGTFVERAWRNRFYRLDDVYEVWVKASLESCLERNRQRAEPIPDRAVRTMYDRFDPPRADLVVDTERLDIGAAVDRLEEAVLEWLSEN